MILQELQTADSRLLQAEDELKQWQQQLTQAKQQYETSLQSMREHAKADRAAAAEAAQKVADEARTAANDAMQREQKQLQEQLALQRSRVDELQVGAAVLTLVSFCSRTHPSLALWHNTCSCAYKPRCLTSHIWLVTPRL